MAKKLLKESLGTFILVFMGTTTAALTGNILATAFAFGLAVVAAAYVFGGDFNPAVSFARFLKKDLSATDFLLNFVSQVVGALLGTLVLWVFLGDNVSLVGLGANTLQGGFATADLGIVVGLLAETILTFIFVLVILTVSRSDSNHAPLVIGLVLVGVVIVGFNITGTSVNPARSLAPALFVGGQAIKEVWLFIVAPLLGGGLAALLDGHLTKE